MYKQLTLSILIAGSLIACRKKSGVSPQDLPPATDSIQGKYMIFDAGGIGYTPGTGSNGYFSFQGNRISRRNGGFLPAPLSGAMSGPYSKDVYDTVIYQQNRIILETRTNVSGIIMPVNKRELILENGRIAKKIYHSNISDHKDTALYFYAAGNRISRKEIRYSDRTQVQVFTFDAQGNLQKIKTTLQISGQTTPNWTAEESFFNYDTRPNPLKGYWMWDDLYYRSLSTNNFAKYEFMKTYQTVNGPAMEARGMEWVLVPHAKGYVDYGK